jgi:hypothetical protein
MVTVEHIFAAFPEFRRADPLLVAHKLYEAELQIAPDYGASACAGAFDAGMSENALRLYKLLEPRDPTFPPPDPLAPLVRPQPSAQQAIRDMVVSNLTAALLVLTPAGEFARLDPNKEADGARSIYERRVNELHASFLPRVLAL